MARADELRDERGADPAGRAGDEDTHDRPPGGSTASARSMSVAVITIALEAAGAVLEERRELARQRQAVIAANADLRERELIKLASLAYALSDALRRRGVDSPASGLAAEAGIAVFRIAFERWMEDGEQRQLPQLIRVSLDELRAVTAGE
jgi:hypothetical protein